MSQFESSDADVTRLGTEILASTPTASADRVARAEPLAPGHRFGSLRILGLLGRGGMGEVYEAQEEGSDRRVALKILGRALVAPDASARFLREGRLAASVSHPNSVYVYGTQEIDGVPAIVMELVPGGTLEEFVAREGPLSPTRAVDATLEIIAGLEAAETRGVLHRDIKPSNCFIGQLGSVKIGDYGLSLSLSTADETRLTMAGTFLGTPAFASPEQVRVGESDVRSDLYSVGATLYFLLTGRPPFADGNVMQVLAAVLQETPTSPRTVAPAVPDGLAQVVLRALRKDPASRFATYADFREALLPFSSQPVEAALLRTRLLATLIDFAVWLPIGLVFELVPHESPPAAFLHLATVFAAQAAYYTVLEGHWGASLGKRALGLRVVGLDGGVPGWRAAAVRALTWLTFLSAADMAVLGGLEELGIAYWAINVVALMVLFATIRTQNGRRGLHELASATQTIRIFGRQEARRQDAVRPAKVHPALSHIGRYAVHRSLWRSNEEAVDAAEDEALRRPVWIHHRREGGPPLSAARRDVARTARLRYLDSGTTEFGPWHAFESLDGGPAGTESWPTVSSWLLELAREIDSAIQDGTMPALVGVDRLWIGGDGSVRLVEFPVLGVAASPTWSVTEVGGAQAFLYHVALHCLGGDLKQHPLPLRARTLLDQFSRRAFATFADVTRNLEAVARGDFGLSRSRRVAMMAPGVALALLTAAVAITNLFPAMALSRNADVTELRRSLILLASLDREAEALASVGLDGPRRFAANKVEAFRVQVGHRWESIIGAPSTWALIERHSRRNAHDLKPVADRAIAAARSAGVEGRRLAVEEARPLIEEVTQALTRDPLWRAEAGAFSAILCFVFVFHSVVSLLAAVAVRGTPMMKLLGADVIGPDGLQVSRARAAWRATITWSPALLAATLVPVVGWLVEPGTQRQTVLFLVTAVAHLAALAGALWTINDPNRGPADRLANTRVVPV